MGPREGNGDRVEYYFDAVTQEVMVNVTDVYDAELRKVLTELGGEFSYAGVEYGDLLEDSGEWSQWMFLLGATIKEKKLEDVHVP